MKKDSSSKTLLLVICGLTLVGLCGLLLVYIRGGETPAPEEDDVEEVAPSRPRPVGPTRLRTTASQPSTAATSARTPTPAPRTPPRAQPAPAPSAPAPSTALAPTPFGADPAAPVIVGESHEDRIKRLTRELAEARRTKSLTRARYDYKAHELKELKEVVAREKEDRARGLPVNR